MRTLKLIISGLCSLLLCLNQAQAQHQLGLRNSNYNTVQGLQLNPAASIDNPFKWNANLVSLSAFVENNYVYFKDASLLQVITSLKSIGPSKSVQPYDLRSYDLEYDFFDNAQLKFANVTAQITGPAFNIKLSPDHSIGLFTNARSQANISDVSSDINYYDITNLDLGSNIRFDKNTYGSVSWAEVGLNYATNLLSDEFHELSLGVNVKYLMGYEAAQFRFNEPMRLVIDLDSLSLTNINVSANYASSLGLFDNSNEPGKFEANGKGGSFDIGLSYKIKSTTGYKWKFGLSFRDLGAINFNKNGENHSVDVDGLNAFNPLEFLYIQNPDDIWDVIINETVDDVYTVTENHSFRVGLPASISLQAEYGINKNFYVNFTAVRDLSIAESGLEAQNIFALSPRFESKWFEFHLPLVLYNDSDFRVGTALKLGPLSVGTDNISGWFFKSDVAGGDIYASLTLQPFGNGKKREKKKKIKEAVESAKNSKGSARNDL